MLFWEYYRDEEKSRDEYTPTVDSLVLRLTTYVHTYYVYPAYMYQHTYIMCIIRVHSMT